jgi:putative endopeptidase
LSNMQEFYDAFGVKEGDKMYRPKAERAEIW